MMMPVGPLACAHKGWGLKGGTITSAIAENHEGRPEVLCAQMVCAAAISGVKVLVLLSGDRGDDPAWQAIGKLLGGGDRRTAADMLRELPLLMYASGTGRDRVGEAELVYAPGLRMGDLEEIQTNTKAAILTLSESEGEVPGHQEVEVLCVGGDFVMLDAEGYELPMTYDPTGPVYRPVLTPGPDESVSAT